MASGKPIHIELHKLSKYKRPALVQFLKARNISANEEMPHSVLKEMARSELEQSEFVNGGQNADGLGATNSQSNSSKSKETSDKQKFHRSYLDIQGRHRILFRDKRLRTLKQRNPNVNIFVDPEGYVNMTSWNSYDLKRCVEEIRTIVENYSRRFPLKHTQYQMLSKHNRSEIDEISENFNTTIRLSYSPPSLTIFGDDSIDVFESGQHILKLLKIIRNYYVGPALKVIIDILQEDAKIVVSDDFIVEFDTLRGYVCFQGPLKLQRTFIDKIQKALRYVVQVEVGDPAILLQYDKDLKEKMTQSGVKFSIDRKLGVMNIYSDDKEKMQKAEEIIRGIEEAYMRVDREEVPADQLIRLRNETGVRYVVGDDSVYFDLKTYRGQGSIMDQLALIKNSPIQEDQREQTETLPMLQQSQITGGPTLSSEILFDDSERTKVVDLGSWRHQILGHDGRQLQLLGKECGIQSYYLNKNAIVVQGEQPSLEDFAESVKQIKENSLQWDVSTPLHPLVRLGVESDCGALVSCVRFGEAFKVIAHDNGVYSNGIGTKDDLFSRMSQHDPFQNWLASTSMENIVES